MLLAALSLLVALECAQSRPTDLVHSNNEDVHSSATAKKPSDTNDQEKFVNKLSQPQDTNSVSVNNAPANVSDKVVENLSKSEAAPASTQLDIPNHRQGKCFGYKGNC